MPRIAAFVLAALLLVPMAGAAKTLDVDAVIARNIQARGGLARLRAIKTLVIRGTFSAGSFHMEHVGEYKRPDMVRIESIIQGMTGIEAYDGKAGWRVSPFEGRRDPELISRDDLKSLIESADFDGPLVDYKAKGNRATLLGIDSMEGTPCYKIRLDMKDGNVRTCYIDTDTFLELKVASRNQVRGTVYEAETYLGDYEKVDGIYFPFETDIGQKGQAERGSFTVKSVTINPPLADSLFTMPVGGAK